MDFASMRERRGRLGAVVWSGGMRKMMNKEDEPEPLPPALPALCSLSSNLKATLSYAMDLDKEARKRLKTTAFLIGYLGYFLHFPRKPYINL